MSLRENAPDEASATSWVKIIKKYNHPDSVKSWWQFSSNLLLYAIAWFLMIESLSVSYWITLALAIPSAGILVRLFIIYHDCSHGSYLKSGRMSDILGLFIGILTFTPYYSWGRNHQIHHETAGNLDKRGIGDVWTLTVEEYRNGSRWQRIMYRVYRNPVTMFGVGTLYVFLIGNRFTKKNMNKMGRIGVYLTNAGLLVFAAAMIMVIGVKPFIMIQLPVIYFAGIMGFWLFYVQHQFNPSYWSREKTWDYKTMALEGSSYYKLPRILHWFTGNIGYHHIHHLSPLIPNYNLRKCHIENTLFRGIKPLTFRASLKTLTLRLWNEETREMISFRRLRLI
ncbi:MAG: fatty acid desaturase [Bacteroidetes bacterium]|nr:fatty acid desaturase [Bacteroidota bacterium]